MRKLDTLFTGNNKRMGDKKRKMWLSIWNHLNQRKVYLCNFKYLKLNDENQTNQTIKKVAECNDNKRNRLLFFE